MAQFKILTTKRTEWEDAHTLLNVQTNLLESNVELDGTKLFNQIAVVLSRELNGAEVRWNFDANPHGHYIRWTGPIEDRQTRELAAFFEHIKERYLEIGKSGYTWFDALADQLLEEGYTILTNNQYVDMSMRENHEKLLGLLLQAAASCTFRGHKMKWRLIPDRNLIDGECVVCERGVTIDPEPPPNGIDIGGEAVALGCIAPFVKIEVSGGCADLVKNVGDVDVEILDYDNLSTGNCPRCGDILSPEWGIYVPEALGQIAAEPEETIDHLFCATCGWQEDE